MRFITPFILALAFVLPTELAVHAQTGKTKPASKAKDEIPWKAGRKLTWADFKGKPGPRESKYALTTSDINVGIGCEGATFHYEVKATFIPSESWTRSLDSDALLAHEQLHFDITELHARKLRLMLSMLPSPCAIDGKELQKMVNNAYQVWHTMEDDYE